MIKWQDATTFSERARGIKTSSSSISSLIHNINSDKGFCLRVVNDVLMASVVIG